MTHTMPHDRRHDIPTPIPRGLPATPPLDFPPNSWPVAPPHPTLAQPTTLAQPSPADRGSKTSTTLKHLPCHDS